eukprot:3991855-Alexandrium_andersonii.AAC.1
MPQCAGGAGENIPDGSAAPTTRAKSEDSCTGRLLWGSQLEVALGRAQSLIWELRETHATS